MKYRVRVQLPLAVDVVVDAETPADAEDVARAAVTYAKFATLMEFLYDDPHPVAWDTSAVPVPDDARLSTYTCPHCNTASLKGEFGPGRLTCPRCKRQP